MDSSFSAEDPARASRDADVNTATHHLVNRVIPTLANELKGDIRQILQGTYYHCYLELADLCEELTISEFLHKHGVNLRHAGLLR
jgi:hypothetical protein